MKKLPKTLTVQVTQRDIDAAKNSRLKRGQYEPSQYEPSQHCPIARAIRRCLKSKAVTCGYASIHYKYGKVLYNLPADAIKFVAMFDGKKAVKPITLELRRFTGTTF